MTNNRFVRAGRRPKGVKFEFFVSEKFMYKQAGRPATHSEAGWSATAREIRENESENPHLKNGSNRVQDSAFFQQQHAMRVAYIEGDGVFLQPLLLLPQPPASPFRARFDEGFFPPNRENSENDKFFPDPQNAVGKEGFFFCVCSGARPPPALVLFGRSDSSVCVVFRGGKNLPGSGSLAQVVPTYRRCCRASCMYVCM